MFQIVDSHCHVISKDTLRYPLAPVGGHQSDWSAKRPVSYAELLKAMDDAGVFRSVVVQASTAYGNDNSYAAEAVKAHPDRLTGVFSIDVLAADAVTQMKRWLDSGFSGLRLFTTGTTMPGQADWLDDERSFPVWEYAQAKQVSICLQMTSSGIPALQRMLHLFPDCRVLLDHMARPDLAEGPPYAASAPLFGLASHGGVYLKLTHRVTREAARGASTPEAFFTKLLAAFGAQRIAWGSNFPAAEGTLASLLEEAQTSVSMLTDRDKQWVFGDAARAIYPSLVG